MNAPAVRSKHGEEVLERKRFSGAEWDRMLASGLFDEDQRLELLRRKPSVADAPEPPRHPGVVSRA